jgi:hypothetical protein
VLLQCVESSFGQAAELQIIDHGPSVATSEGEWDGAPGAANCLKIGQIVIEIIKVRTPGADIRP